MRLKLDSNQKLFESDHFNTNDLCNKILITVDASMSIDFDCSSYEIELYDLTSDKSRKLEDFPKNERDKIESIACDLFNSLHSDYCSDYVEYRLGV